MRNLGLKYTLCDSGSMHPTVKNTVALSLLKINKENNSKITFGQIASIEAFKSTYYFPSVKPNSVSSIQTLKLRI